jgi:hypothetical protein
MALFTLPPNGQPGPGPASAGRSGLMSAADKRKLDGWPLVRLDHDSADDLLSGTALTGGAWTDVLGNLDFEVNSPTSLLLVTVRLSVAIISSVATHSCAARAMIDSAGAAPTFLLGGDLAVVNDYGNVACGSFAISGLDAGTHTIKLQVIDSQNATAYCRAASVSDYEFAKIDIVELTP